jgi:hypothetical protein
MPSTFKILILALLITFSFLATSIVAHASLTEERVDNEWVVDKVTDDMVYASINGGVIHGDRLMIIMQRGSCENGTMATTIYSYIEPTVVSKLDGKSITASLDGRDIKVSVVKTFPFLMGSHSLVEIMNVSIKNFLKTMPEDYTLELIYKDTPIGDVKNFFDIDHNNWKMTGVISAVQRAQKICRNL